MNSLRNVKEYSLEPTFVHTLFKQPEFLKQIQYFLKLVGTSREKKLVYKNTE